MRGEEEQKMQTHLVNREQQKTEYLAPDLSPGSWGNWKQSTCDDIRASASPTLGRGPVGLSPRHIHMRDMLELLSSRRNVRLYAREVCGGGGACT